MQPTDTCSCGRRHRTSTHTVVIEHDALAHLSEICAEWSHILVVADGHTYAACGERAVSRLGDRVTALQIFEDEALIPNEDALAAVTARLEGIEHIVGVGSGVINDICKYIAHENHLRYTIVATAPSMDGYASAGAALILGGMKVTLPAAPPEVIVADTGVLANAPMDMIRAGYGDIVGKYSCLNDWKLAALLRGEYICPAVWQWVKETTDRVRSLADGINRREPAAIQALMQALVDVGIAMAYVGSSRPASGSEHHIAHYLEITGILRDRPYLAHGVDVVGAAVLTARLREAVRQGTPHPRPYDRAAYAATMEAVYGPIAASVVTLQDRMGWYQDAGIEALALSRLEEIRALLAEAPTEAEARAMMEAVGLSFDDFTAFYGDATLDEAILWGKDLKDRYTVLWLYHTLFSEGTVPLSTHDAARP